MKRCVSVQPLKEKKQKKNVNKSEKKHRKTFSNIATTASWSFFFGEFKSLMSFSRYDTQFADLIMVIQYQQAEFVWEPIRLAWKTICVRFKSIIQILRSTNWNSKLIGRKV